MSKPATRRYWILWLVLSVALGCAMAWANFRAVDRTIFMPGPLSPGHHQLAEACEVCHTDGFGGREALQEACVDCHGEDRVKPLDSHPKAKFTDPRNADRLEQINALQCVSCHVEHKPEITLKDGLTQPRDVCFHCHSEIAEDRPSHEGMDFSTCKDSGCHNFHDNRALYTDFLLKHIDDPELENRPRVPGREFADVVEEIMEYPRDDYPVQPLGEGDQDAPAPAADDTGLVRDWLETAHARAGVNCSACHQPRDESGQRTAWTDHPGVQGCAGCHELEVERFGKGRHGMRVAAGLSPMTPESARLPMREQAAHEELNCVSCHAAHRFDVAHAAADACLDCHEDGHSLAYEGSPHHALWLKERSGEARPDTGVSCATCHMPRVDFDVNDWMSRIMVDHNQSATLSPNSKMIRPACLHCHGLGFTIDALADKKLIETNFNGRPAAHVQSMELARRDHDRYLREKKQAAP